MYAYEYYVELARKTTPVFDAINIAVKLDRDAVMSGKNIKIHCPFHKEKTPSFIINPKRKIYHCFGCGKSGEMKELEKIKTTIGYKKPKKTK